MKIIILAGGGGTRLFPLSRACYPKQFLKIAGEKSLLQQTVERFLIIAKQEDVVIVTNKDYIFHVQEDLHKIGAEKINIITELTGKNTAPAIALAISYCKDCLNCCEDEILFVSPADHLIKPAEKFAELVQQAEQVCKEKNDIITIGVKPTKPETGYGYIQSADKIADNVLAVKSFKEKPDKLTAEQYLVEGNYYWNAGMFMFSIGRMETELEQYIPEIAKISQQGYENCVNNFTEMPDISIDYAVAEKSTHMAVMPMQDIYWNDIGSFDSIAEVLADKNGNGIYGDVITDDCQNTTILGCDRLISGIGLKNLIVVDTPDSLLITEKGKSQEVKKVIEKLRKEHRKEAIENRTMYRPWGSYTILAEGESYKVKRITIKPGAKLSLQMHYHRSEHWTVISGTGKLTLDDKVVIFKENESTYIPIAVKHRLENPGQIPLSIIEVQNGRYLGEDDIVRFDDEYGRN
mgnify:FL=1